MAKSQRRQIRLDSDDLAAASQILAYIARPHRPGSVDQLINAWICNSERPSRLEPKIGTLVKDLLNTFEAARWLQRSILSNFANTKEIMLPDSGLRFKVTGFPGVWPVTSLRRSALARAGGSEGSGNAFRDIWSKRRPVVHLALAAANEMGKLHRAQSSIGLDINLAVRDGSWVKPALLNAEAWARSAQSLSILPLGAQWHFSQRDSF